MTFGACAPATRTSEMTRDLAYLLGNLAHLSRTLSQVTTLRELLEVAAEEVRIGLGASTVSLSRLEPGSGNLRTLINVGELGPDEERWPENEVYSLQHFANLRGIVTDLQTWTIALDDPNGDAAEQALLTKLGKESAMAAPVLVNNALWGELYVTYTDASQAFVTNDGPYVEVYLAILESAINSVTQIETLERLAFRDPLTGLPNRRALDEAATAAFALLSSDTMKCINVVSIDLNGLKGVNDTRGHAAGDGLITRAGVIIQKHFNGIPDTLTARIGGDEFAVLVPSCNVDLVIATARTACDAIADLSIGEGASCGVAVANTRQLDHSVAALFRRADAALYQSKASGQLEVAEFGITKTLLESTSTTYRNGEEGRTDSSARPSSSYGGSRG